MFYIHKKNEEKKRERENEIHWPEKEEEDKSLQAVLATLPTAANVLPRSPSEWSQFCCLELLPKSPLQKSKFRLFYPIPPSSPLFFFPVDLDKESHSPSRANSSDFYYFHYTAATTTSLKKLSPDILHFYCHETRKKTSFCKNLSIDSFFIFTKK